MGTAKSAIFGTVLGAALFVLATGPAEASAVKYPKGVTATMWVRNVTTAGSFAATATANAGDAVEYQVTIGGSLKNSENNVVADATLSGGESFVSCSDGCTVTGTNVRWSLGTLAAGATRTVTFQTKVGANNTGSETYLNDSTTVSAQGSAASTSNTTTVSVNPTPPPPTTLSISELVNGSPTLGPGNGPPASATYAITVKNPASSDATNVVINDPITDGNSTFASCSDACTFDSTTKTVSWNVGTLASGASVTRSFLVNIGGVFACCTYGINNQSTVDATGQTRQTSNNAVIYGSVYPSQYVTDAVRDVTTGGSFAASTSASPGDTLEYEYSYTNGGNASGSFALYSPLEAQEAFLSCTDSCTQSTSQVSFSSGVIDPGQSVLMTYQVKLASSFPSGTTSIAKSANYQFSGLSPKTTPGTTVTVTAP